MTDTRHIEVYSVGGVRPWRFQEVAPNGEVVSRSARHYLTKWNAKRGARRAHPGLPVREGMSA